MDKLIPVILSGGSGTRLWPFSRAKFPKQFLPLLEDKTMLQSTVERLSSIRDISAPMVVCNEDHRFIVAEQLREIEVKAHSILLEPEPKNTAPAIALAALHAISTDDDPILMVLPADHQIEDAETFAKAVDIARAAVETNLVTFGITPTYAETGYGYIRANLNDRPSGEACLVSDFLEKPSRKLAEKYINSGDYLWNSGMFLFRATLFIQCLEKFSPVMLEQCKRAYKGVSDDLDFTRVDGAVFTMCDSNSIDYEVMEPASKEGIVKVVPLDAGWSDIGSWSSLWSALEKDEQGNSTRGDVLLQDTENSHIQGDGKLIAVLGVKDTIIVQTDDAVMVAAKDRAQDIKQIVEILKVNQRAETDYHRKVFRPWGYYDSIDVGDSFQVKRLVVKPGAKLSVQTHQFRAEHWVVVSGVAEVRNGDETFLLKQNESTYIPIGAIHSLANPFEEPLEIIEVQSGSYFGEDDIERLEDDYGRK